MGGPDLLGDACDDDDDGDGYTDANEQARGKASLAYCAIMRADIPSPGTGLSDGVVGAADLSFAAARFNQHGRREDQNVDDVVNSADLARMAPPPIFGHRITECP